MYLIRSALYICGVITGLIVLAWLIRIIVNIFKIIIDKLKGNPIGYENLKIFNPLLILNLINDVAEDNRFAKWMKVILLLGIISITIDIISYTPMGSATMGSIMEKKSILHTTM